MSGFFRQCPVCPIFEISDVRFPDTGRLNIVTVSEQSPPLLVSRLLIFEEAAMNEMLVMSGSFWHYFNTNRKELTQKRYILCGNPNKYT